MTPETATLLGIGELAERTGLSVRTIRFYSDSGVVPPAGRTDAGYRLYGPDALARLALVRTLQRAVLTVVARRESDPEEMQTMHRLAQLSDDERRRIVALRSQ